MSRDCCVAPPHDVTRVFLQFVIVLFPDHTHLLFLVLIPLAERAINRMFSQPLYLCRPFEKKNVGEVYVQYF